MDTKEARKMWQLSLLAGSGEDTAEIRRRIRRWSRSPGMRAEEKQEAAAAPAASAEPDSTRTSRNKSAPDKNAMTDKQKAELEQELLESELEYMLGSEPELVEVGLGELEIETVLLETETETLEIVTATLEEVPVPTQPADGENKPPQKRRRRRRRRKKPSQNPAGQVPQSGEQISGNTEHGSTEKNP